MTSTAAASAGGTPTASRVSCLAQGHGKRLIAPKPICSADMDFQSICVTPCWRGRVAFVLFATSLQPASVLIIATLLGRCEASFAILAMCKLAAVDDAAFLAAALTYLGAGEC